MLLLLMDLVYGCAIATQYVAWRLAYHPNLGPAALIVGAELARCWHAVGVVLFAAAGVAFGWPASRRAAPLLAVAGATACALAAAPLYAPQRLAVWLFAYRHEVALQGILRQGVEFGGAAILAGVIATLSLMSRGRRWVSSGSHGTAVWGDPRTLVRDQGLVVGRVAGSPRRSGALMRYDGDGHLMTVAPTRSGKGVGVVMTNLLSYPGSVLVTDVKGENFAVSGHWRGHGGLGQAVHVLDPFDHVGGKARYNPLDLIDRESPDALDDAAMLADMIVVSEGPNESVFWAEEAKAWLTGLILHVVTAEPPVNRTLSRVRHLLGLEKGQQEPLLAEMKRNKAYGGVITRAAARLDQKEGPERSGVLSSAQSHTHFLESMRIGKSLSESTFAWESLAEGNATVYLVMPPDHLRTYRRWVRLMIACALRQLVRAGVRGSHRVLVLLDEFAQLGRMAVVEDAITLVAGYGVTLWPLVQDIGQLKKTYPNGWATFLANSDVLQAFGVNDGETAEWLSKLTGDATIRVQSESRTSGASSGRGGGGHQESAGETASERGRRLIMPDEVRCMESDEQLLFVRGRRPFSARRPDYRVDPELQARARPNPMYASR
ncbi:MAG TPA: type IV secretory system conjugative DNA transfer family protein [Gemmatimonadaceae bacterium]|nr:type IV secretory system conjugative DNA transfer family protein [Gemmatimonadaceae bacterium]